MNRDPRSALLAAALALTIAALGCTSLSYPTAEGTATAKPADAATPPSPPVLVGIGSAGAGDEAVASNSADSSGSPDVAARLEWSELTRLARLDRQRGDIDSARQRLERAAAQLAGEPATNAQRQTVFGARARLAMDLISLERTETANALADELFDEAEKEPALGGPALVELAYLVAKQRAQPAEGSRPDVLPLRLLRLALVAAEADTASQSRLNLAFEISEEASRQGDHALARRAVDLALLDAGKIAPADRDQRASLLIYKARVALAQNDLIGAERAAIAASRLFEEIGAATASRAIAESTLARVLAMRGETERARAIAIGAEARLAPGPDGKSVAAHPARIVRGELARAAVATGDVAGARAQLEAALALPPVDFAADRLLRSKLRQELDALSLAESEVARERP